MQRRIALSLAVILALSTLLSVPTRAIVRSPIEINSGVNFDWNRSFRIGESELAFAISCPMRLSVSGLTDKVLPGENFNVRMAIDFTPGSYLILGSSRFNLDEPIRRLLTRIEKIDLKPLEELVLHAAKSITLCVAGRIASETIGLVGRIVIDNTDMWIMNELEVEALTSGPVTVSNSLLRTWFGKSATMILQVGQVTQRGLSMAVSYVSRWVMRLHFDFKQSLYSHPLVGGIVRKIRDALRLPWEPELGTAEGGSTPVLSSRILVPDFAIEAMSSTQAVIQGEQARFTISLTSLDEFDSLVRLTIQGLPKGATGYFRPQEITPTADTMLMVETSPTTNPGSYALTVIGAGGGKTHQFPLQLVVNARPEIRASDTRISTWTGGQPPVWITEQMFILMMAAISAVLLIGLTYAIVRKRTAAVPADYSLGPSRDRPEKAASPSRVRPTHPSAITVGTVFCRFCGVRIHSDAAYCPMCGRKQPATV